MNKIPLYFFLIVMSTLNTLAYASEQSDDATAVRQVMARLVDTYNSGDLEEHVAMFAENAIELPPNQPSVHGRDAIYRRKKASMEKADAVLKAIIEEVVVSGDWAIVRITGAGKIAMKGGPTINSDAKAILVWKRQADGSWWVTHDIWNSNLPAAPH